MFRSPRRTLAAARDLPDPAPLPGHVVSITATGFRRRKTLTSGGIEVVRAPIAITATGFHRRKRGQCQGYGSASVSITTKVFHLLKQDYDMGAAGFETLRSPRRLLTAARWEWLT